MHAALEGRRVMQVWQGSIRDVGSEDGFFAWCYTGFEENHFFLADVLITTDGV